MFIVKQYFARKKAALYITSNSSTQSWGKGQGGSNAAARDVVSH